MPAYNAGRYIKKTVLSLVDQTHTDWELIVVNDGSTDNTKYIIAEFTHDERIRLIDTEKGGASKARNIAYKNAYSNYIIFLDADDQLSPTFLHTQLKKLDNFQNALVLSDWGRFYSDETRSCVVSDAVLDNEMSFPAWIAKYWYNCNPMTNPGRALIPRSLIERSGLWNEQLSLNDDLEFFTRIMLNADKIIFNPDALLAYRSGVAGLSSTRGEKAMLSLFNSIELSVTSVLDKYGDQLIIRRSCANMWQHFIYEAYPLHKHLIEKAKKHLKALPEPTIKYPSGGYTRFLLNFVNWESVKKVKLGLEKIRITTY